MCDRLTPCAHRVSLWLRAHAHLSAQEYVQCAHTLKQLDDRSPLHENAHMLVTLGRAFYCGGDQRNAASTLQRVRLLEPLLCEGMDLLADLLHHERKAKELEALATQLMAAGGDVHPEPWIAMAYHTLLGKRPQRALYFAHKVSGTVGLCYGSVESRRRGEVYSVLNNVRRPL